MPLEQITTEMDVQVPQKGKKLQVMKKKVVQKETPEERAETIRQGKELDRTVASPYKMALDQRAKDSKDKEKTEAYKSAAMNKIYGFAPAKEEIKEKIGRLPDRTMLVRTMKKK